MTITQTRTCKGCPDRHIGCHGNCTVYAAYAANIAERNAAIRYERLCESMTVERMVRGARIMRKKKR